VNEARIRSRDCSEKPDPQGNAQRIISTSKMIKKEIISWLLKGDVSIQYQVYRDLLDVNKPALRKKIGSEGWGLRFLNCRNPNGHWGKAFYQPKWTSTHYTLLDLKNLNILPNKAIKETLDIILKNEKGPDGGIKPIGIIKHSDVCVNGMVLNYACYFNSKEENLKSIVDFLLSQKMDDGGFNCQSNRKGAIHSSLHTTLSVLEGIHEYEKNNYTYRLDELKKAKLDSLEFILIHKLFRSHRTGEIINPNFIKFHYPCRWYYDILKAMDYFQLEGVKYDKRMGDALQIILEKRTEQGHWKLSSKYPGETHFEMEKSGEPSRWITLRALRVLKHFNVNE
jgi:hypothetical protein